MTTVFNLDNFKLFKNYVIEASAGTGKTYNIVEIVKKVVNQKDVDGKPITLDKILIVTYTEKAAGELKDRIRNELKNEDVDNASIYTIHSFCQQTIKEFGISANLPLDLSVISDEKLNNFADRYLRESAMINDITLYASLKKFNINSLRKMLVESLKKYYLNANFLEDESIIKLEEVSSEERYIFNLYSDLNKAEKFDDIIDSYSDIAANYFVFENSCETKAINFKTELNNGFKNGFNFSGTKFHENHTWSKTPLIHDNLVKAFLFFKDLRDKLKKYFFNDSSKTMLYAYMTKIYLKDFYIAWQKEKELNKYQTFNDMLRDVRESVLKENSALKERLMSKYRYAIIDEFQDTNQLQFDIFKHVFLTPKHNIIVVGDPKQSIYSFQGADVEVYHQAKEEIKNSGGYICELKKNYRSTPSMVSSCNKLFHQFNFLGTKFSDCDTLNEKDNQEEHKVLYDGSSTLAFWMPSLKLNADDFAKLAVEAIIDCCTVDDKGHTKLQVKDKKAKEFRNVSFKDFAVLAKSRSEMEPMERALKSVGIPYLRYKDTRLFSGKECADWITIFNALNVSDFSGHNRKKFKKTLFTNFFKLDLKSIKDEKYDNDSSDEILLLKKWKQIALEEKWEELVDNIIVESGFIEKMTSLSEIQSLGVYKQLGNYCIEYLSNNHTIKDLIADLEAKAAGDVEEDENGPIIAKSTNFDCVQMMTMHASKGLQYPVVIPVGGFKGLASDSIVSYHTKMDEKDLHILGFGSNDESDKEKIEEVKRLYYVAYTRPQFVMILPYYEQYGQKLDFIPDAITKYIDENPNGYKPLSLSNKTQKELSLKVKEILAHSFKDSKIKEDLLARSNQEEVLAKINAERNIKSTFKHSYSTLTHPKACEEELEDLEDEKTDGLEMFDLSAKQINTNINSTIDSMLLPPNYPRGNKVGSALHKIFELIDFTNYDDVILDVIDIAFKDEGIKLAFDLISPTVNMVNHVLNATLPVVKGSKVKENETLLLSSLTKDNIKAELEFNFNYKDEKMKNYFNGFIDLLFKNGEVYSILDWKSDSLSEEFSSYASNIELKKHVDKAYSIQRVLYAYCLIKWLKTYYNNKSYEQIFNDHFGGVYYVFLRGCYKGTGNGIYTQTWECWDDLEREFYNIMNHKMWRR